MSGDGEELWSAAQVAEWLGNATTAGARRTLSRWGVEAREYRRHPVSGRPMALFAAEDVRAAKAAQRPVGRPPKNPRTDQL